MTTATKVEPKAKLEAKIGRVSTRALNKGRCGKSKAVAGVLVDALETAAKEDAAAILCECNGKLVKIPKGLSKFMDYRPYGSEMIGAAEAASRLKVSQATVRSWVRKRKLIGWKSSQLGLTIPKEQILGPGKVAQGIKEIVQIIGDPGTAWSFLDSRSQFGHDSFRPIDKLKLGRVEEVLGEAECILTGGM